MIQRSLCLWSLDFTRSLSVLSGVRDLKSAASRDLALFRRVVMILSGVPVEDVLIERYERLKGYAGVSKSYLGVDGRNLAVA